MFERFCDDCAIHVISRELIHKWRYAILTTSLSRNAALFECMVSLVPIRYVRLVLKATLNSRKSCGFFLMHLCAELRSLNPVCINRLVLWKSSNFFWEIIPSSRTWSSTSCYWEQFWKLKFCKVLFGEKHQFCTVRGGVTDPCSLPLLYNDCSSFH